MEIREEEENLWRARKVIDDDLQPRLRDFFKKLWNAKRSQNQPAWSDSTNDGQELFKKLKKKLPLSDKIKSGDTKQWDATCLFEAILTVADETEKKSICVLRRKRNMVFHRTNGNLSENEKKIFFSDLKKEYTKLTWRQDIVEKIETVPISTKEMKILKAQLAKDRKIALKGNQDNLCQLPSRIKNFVGRQKEINESQEILLKGEEFLIITGGPCYGKSSLAIELGYLMFEDRFNYVIWINMRDISSSPPSLEDTARKILQEFTIDTISMKDDIVQSLINKFELITSSGKAALIIFDNADDLIASKGEGLPCRSSTYTELSRYIRNNSRESIRAVFTTRVHRASGAEALLCNMELGTLLDEESEEFLRSELTSNVGFDRETRISEIVNASHGLPIALRMICSNLEQMKGKEMMEDYLNDLKQDPLKNVSEDFGIHKLFALSMKHLGEKKEQLHLLLSLLVVFPSRFSYKYIKKLSDILKDGKIEPLLLNTLKSHSLIQDDSRARDKSGGETTNTDFYTIHPFFRQYIREEFWDEGKEKKYELAYYKLYTKQLFFLAKEALKKDNYLKCLKEFEVEQHNFFHMMKQIGNTFEECKYSSFLKEIFREVLEREIPDYIAASLFCIDITSPSLLLKFFEGCEVLVDVERKESIWCCRYDLHMKYFDKKICNPYKSIKRDVYGEALMQKRSIATKIYISPRNKGVEKDFCEINRELETFSNSINSLECSIMRAYFSHKSQKLKGLWLKKGLGRKGRDVQEDCIDAFTKALKICEESFGKSWLTIDSHNQLGKMFWCVGDREKARAAFDSGIELAESMSLGNNKKFGSCLLDKGRFLVESDIEEEKNEGISLLENVLERCNDFSDIKFRCRAMAFLLKVDKSKTAEVKQLFSDTNNLCSSVLSLIDEAINIDIYSSDVDVKEESFEEYEKAKLSDLKAAILKLEDMWNLETSREKDDDSDFMALSKDVKKFLYLWQMRAALKYNHVLPLNERKEFARKALEILNGCPSIGRKKEGDLKTLVDFHCLPDEEELLREMFFLNRIKQILLRDGKDNKLMQRYAQLIEKSDDNQKIWSLIVLHISRGTPTIYEEVEVINVLLRQPEPCEDLLKLVRYKFDYQIRIYEREADENKIMVESKKAVHGLQAAIKYIQELLSLERYHMDGNVTTRLENDLWFWSKLIALNTGHYLIQNDLVTYAELTLTKVNKLTVKEKNILSAIQSKNTPLPEQEMIRRKALLVKVTKYMRANEMQSELEKRYEAFLHDCSSFPRIQFEMVKFIISFKNVEPYKFGRYLQFLCLHFETGSLNSGWDFQFVIDVADSLFSAELDISSQRKNYDICKAIYDNLLSSQMTSGVRKKLEFEFLAIFSLKIRSDVRDVRLRQLDAERALQICNSIGSKFKSGLIKYKEQLEQLVKK